MNAWSHLLGVVTIALVLTACGGGEMAVTVDPPAADFAEVTCQPDDVRVEPGRIRPQPDGVHLRVDNPGTDQLMLWGDRLGYESAPPGVTEMVLRVPPGELRLTCLAALESDDPEEQGWPYPSEDQWDTLPVIEVVDTEGLWADDTLACDTPEGWHNDYEWDMTDAPMPPGRQGDPVDLAREDLPEELGRFGELQPGDVLEPAGYAQDTGRVRLVRGGEVVAIVTYRPNGHGGWHFGAVEFCE